ncbi:MAG: transcription termination/antitermination protein NusA [Ruminococcaceae bacterium]|nr:transcription termination/antitermination protein NusA [Oscillospiraceae bacterium]
MKSKKSELLLALEQICEEKNISKDVLLETLQQALILAYKRNYSSVHNNVFVDINNETGAIRVYAQKEVVENVEDDQLHISLEEAKKVKKIYEIGDLVDIEVTPATFGRIAAQTAKQLVMQRIREVERNNIYDEFSQKEGTVIEGVIQRIEKKNIYLDVGSAETYLAPNEQVATEEYDFHQHLKVYVTEVKKTTKGPLITVSRTRPQLVSKLFEQEIPEIKDGIIEVMSVSRDAGSRSKIAVKTNDENVDPIGSCIGTKGMRIQGIIDELNGEKIDIVKYSDDPKEFIKASLSPAEVISLEIDADEKQAHVVVPFDQLSLAIGKEGQNVRLAARLTNYKIDIKSDRDSK